MLQDLPQKVPTDKVCQENLARILPRLLEKGYNVRNEHIFVDAYQSERFGDAYQVGRVPTITRTRASVGGFFNTKMWRFLSTKELEAFQGLPAGRMRYKGLRTQRNRQVSERQYRMMLGSAMSIPVLGRILWKGMLIMKKISADTPDPWETQA